MGIGLIVIICLSFIFLIQYHWNRRHLYKLAYKLPGPMTLPLLGNVWLLFGELDDVMTAINNLANQYPAPMRFWFGPLLLIYYSSPEHIEKILSSSKLVHKHDIYDLMKVYLGDGLISNSGEKYKRHRKLFQPLINQKFVSGNIGVFQKHINICLKKLSVHCNKGTFDIHNLIQHCFTDIIGESILGTEINTQHGKNLQFTQTCNEMYIVGYARLLKPWYHSEFMYSFSSGKKEQTRIANTLFNFVKNNVNKAYNRVRLNQDDSMNLASPIIDQMADMIQKDDTIMDTSDFVHHMLTIYCASEDTMTVIASMLCVCLGMYPDYQEIAAEEIRSVCGDVCGQITYDDLSKLSYLDMCIKEVLRLTPIAPLIVRKTVEDFAIDGLVMPKNCGILVSIFDVHRNPTQWENPNDFFPDHFLAETVEKRHPFAFIPFSAGPRNCIGKKLAYVGLKMIMANILQNFKIRADGKFPDIILKSDITVRSVNGYKVSLEKRTWY